MKKASLFDKVLLGILLTMLLGFVYLRFGVLRPWLRQFEASQPKIGRASCRERVCQYV